MLTNLFGRMFWKNFGQGYISNHKYQTEITWNLISVQTNIFFLFPKTFSFSFTFVSLLVCSFVILSLPDSFSTALPVPSSIHISSLLCLVPDPVRDSASCILFVCVPFTPDQLLLKVCLYIINFAFENKPAWFEKRKVNNYYFAITNTNAVKLI